MLSKLIWLKKYGSLICLVWKSLGLSHGWFAGHQSNPAILFTPSCERTGQPREFIIIVMLTGLIQKLLLCSVYYFVLYRNIAVQLEHTAGRLHVQLLGTEHSEEHAHASQNASQKRTGIHSGSAIHRIAIFSNLLEVHLLGINLITAQYFKVNVWFY